MMSTFFSAQSDAAAVSDLRVWGEKQLIAARMVKILVVPAAPRMNF